jgi:AcrR family transcriptional regulator
MNVFKKVLDNLRPDAYNLNMFNKATPKAQLTRAHLLATALAVFRQRGLEAATMRDLAAAAGTSLGSAYYYFPSKEAIIQAYYDDVQTEHARRVASVLAGGGGRDLKDRLLAAFHAKLDILQGDRKLLGALFRYTGEPDHPLSVLSEGTRKNREESIAVFQTAMGEERLPDDIRALLPTALWALHLALLLYFIYDNSPGQQRTRRLTDGVVTLLVRVVALAKLPVLKPVRGSILTLLRDAELLPEMETSQITAVQESRT